MNRSGLTLTEVVIAVAVTALAYSSIFAAHAGVKALSHVNRSKMQAMQVVRSEVELLRATAFNNVNNMTLNNVSYDAGPDGIFGNADDKKGTLTVAVQDLADFDADGNTTETAINIDADGVNDAGVIKPVRVSFTWTQYILGSKRNYSTFLDTLIAAA